MRLLVENGFNQQIDYLSARMRRQLEIERTPELTSALNQQADSLFAAAREAFGSKVTGSTLAEPGEARLASFERSWRSSFSMVFNSFMDRPLPATELQGVLDDLRTSIAGLPAVVVSGTETEQQLAEKRKAVENLVELLKKSVMKAGAACYKDLATYSQRHLQWRAEVHQVQKLESPKTPPREESVVPPDPKTPSVSSPPPPTKQPETVPASEHTTKDVPPARTNQNPSQSNSRRLGIWIFLGVAALATGIILYSRLRR